MKTKHIVSILTLITSLFAVNQVSALTYQNDTDVDFTINPTISVSLSGDLIINDLTPGSYSDSNIITVNVATNASHGYYLAATVGDSNSSSSNHNTNLTHSTNSNYTFTKLSSNAAYLSDFSDNQWGYSYSTDNGSTWVSGSQGSTSSGYNGLPLDNDDSGATGITLIDTTSPVANNSVKFKIGAKASNTQPAGTYTNTINFYAVTHQAPLTFDDTFAAAGKTKYLNYYKMQDMTSDICANAEQGFNTKLIDVRDNEIYTIAKLKDNNCWMLDNLRLGGYSPITLTNQDTNMKAVTWVLPSNTEVNQFNSYTEARINVDTKNETITSFGRGGGKIGVYYNYCAASVGTICEEQNESNANDDICPANWRLPTGGVNGNFRVLCNAYNSGNSCDDTQLMSGTDISSLQFNLSTPLSGFIQYNNILLKDVASDFWSSTYADSTKTYGLSIRSSALWLALNYPRNFGDIVRCLAK